MKIKSISIIFRRKKKETDHIAEVRSQNKEIVPDSPEASTSTSTKFNINTQSDDSDLHLRRGDNNRTLKCMFENIASQKSK